MKRSKLCFGLLLALVIMLGLSLNVCSDVNALKHEYNGIVTLRYAYPDISCNNGSCSFDWSSNHFHDYPFNGTSLIVSKQGSAWDFSDDNRDNVKLIYSASEVRCDDSSSSPCNLTHLNTMYHVSSTNNVSGFSYSFGSENFYLPSLVTASDPFASSNFYFVSPFGDRNPSVNNAFSGILTCDSLINGAVCPGLWNTAEYVASNVLPYPFSTSGFYLHSKAVDSNGIHYSNTFSLNDLYSGSFDKISSLVIPLMTDNDYFWNSDNLYSGRSFEFSGVFDFDGSFAWNSDLDSDSEFSIHLDGIKKSNGSFVQNLSYQCTTNLITVLDATQLHYSCPFTLQDDFLLLVPSLYINSDNSSCGDDSCHKYLFETDDEWRFASTFLVTDNDPTPGPDFNSTIVGGGTIPGDAENNISNDSADWFTSLTSLFNFNFINPFAPIFNLFNNDSCAQIPTLAGMLHSNETQVCPWFDSSVRNIVTPVLGLSSMMLVFGFVIRWLGGSSGNNFTDSSPPDSGSGGIPKFHYKFGRKIND